MKKIIVMVLVLMTMACILTAQTVSAETWDTDWDMEPTPGFGIGIILVALILTPIILTRNRRTAEDIIPKIQEIVGKKYNVEESNSTGDIQVRSRGVVIFRIYQSIFRRGNPHIVKLDVREHKKISEKVAEGLELELVG